MRAILTAVGFTLLISCAAIFAVFWVLAIATRPEAPLERPGDSLSHAIAHKSLDQAIAESGPLRRLMQARARREKGAASPARFASLGEEPVSPAAVQASAVAAVAAARAAAERGEQAAQAIYVPWPQESARTVAHFRLAAIRRIEGAAEPLALGPNARYERALREGARRTGLSPSTLAALIDAEADQRGDGGWDAASSNPTSTALGLAQFLEAAWIHEAKNKRRQLNRVARRRGLISPKGTVRDKKRLLALRLDSRLSILTAAELAADNLVALARIGYAPKDDAGAARLAYLAHHEGLAGARAHLAGAVAADQAAERLRANIGEERYASLLKAHDGAAEEAYTSWLEGYMDKRIQPQRFVRAVN